jgi:hypothetical protein
MYRFSIIALAIASLALVVAGTAFAEVKVGGALTTDVENFTDQSNGGDDSVSEIRLQTEAILDFSATAGPLVAKIRLEINDVNNGWNNTRHTLTWNINDQMSLAMAGASHGFKAGIAPYGASSIGHLSPMGGNVGDVASITQLVFAINQQTLDFTFKLGGAGEVGVMYSPNDILGSGSVISMVSDLGGGGDTVTFAGAGDKDNASTIVPYFNGNFGGVAVYAYYAMSSTEGTFTERDTSVDPAVVTATVDAKIESTELSVAGVYKADGLTAVLQVAPGTVKLTTDAFEGEIKTMAINVGGEMNGIGAHYLSKKWADENDDVVDETDIAVTYTASLGDGADWSVGYATHADKLAEETDSRVYFGMKAKY